jgi:NADH:ubiquinone oxidoreductase subunit F (NADH-binding)/(2Fe-2S) ferredoxin/NAD-dependent dihydropyrimidine dehydrogenase PreA subunit
MPTNGLYAALAEKAVMGLADRGERSKIRIQVGSATCENAAGAGDVREEFQRHIQAAGRSDIALRQTGCTGRCSREPIVGVFVPGARPVIYERVDRNLVHRIFTEHIQSGKPVLEYILDSDQEPERDWEFLFCERARCRLASKKDHPATLERKLREAGIDMKNVRIGTSRCFGACSQDASGEAAFMLVHPGKTLYRINNESDLDTIIQTHVKGHVIAEDLLVKSDVSRRFFSLYGDVAYFSRQSRIALRNCGVIDPENIEEYIHYQGFEGFARALEKNDHEWTLNEITASKLRGRGGGGFPTGRKWTLGRKSAGEDKVIICNADEGDPGAFMDRSMLESDPFSVIEGMMIGAIAIGANRGFFYVRAEYPMAIRRIENAIVQCRKWGLLGKNVLGTDFSFDIEIRLGAGAFVCGEETALIHSIEGERGQPSIRPPYPVERGLWGLPTVINNVETFANVPAILVYGGEWFERLGRGESGGTKVFALAGKVRQTGLVEVPMGTTLREVVYEIGGGVLEGRELKALQTGGPAGGCIPADLIDTKVDFDSLQAVGSIMGSGGLIVLDNTDCAVDIAKFFIAFSREESCGKCTPCREGTKRMLEILVRITEGRGEMTDLETLQRLALLIKKSSLCGLGRAAPNPVLSTMKHFRSEYEAHILEKRCPAGRCSALLKYEIDPEKCVGCTVCARNCPVPCISGVRREVHTIDQSQCIKCGKCFEVCRFDAVRKM